MYRKATFEDKKSQSEIKVGLCVASEKFPGHVHSSRIVSLKTLTFIPRETKEQMR